jgi:P2-related tail formation protein
MRKILYFITASLSLLAGCTTTKPDVVGSTGASETQLQVREIQTREYATLNKKMTMRSVISTLQDLGFVIDTADAELGTVTATRLNKYTMRMTVTIREKGAEQIAVRANARIGEDNVTDPKTYQDFFAALDKAMFLTLNKVD